MNIKTLIHLLFFCFLFFHAPIQSHIQTLTTPFSPTPDQVSTSQLGPYSFQWQMSPPYSWQGLQHKKLIYQQLQILIQDFFQLILKFSDKKSSTTLYQAHTNQWNQQLLRVIDWLKKGTSQSSTLPFLEFFHLLNQSIEDQKNSFLTKELILKRKIQNLLWLIGHESLNGSHYLKQYSSNLLHFLISHEVEKLPSNLQNAFFEVWNHVFRQIWFLLYSYFPTTSSTTSESLSKVTHNEIWDHAHFANSMNSFLWKLDELNLNWNIFHLVMTKRIIGLNSSPEGREMSRWILALHQQWNGILKLIKNK
jgi:hypothetical protein